MTIGELARKAGVPTSTLRFYERRGLLSPTARSRAGYRRYEEPAVDRVRFLRRAQELGFTLEELGTMLALSDRRGVRGRDIGSLGSAKLVELEERIADLVRVRDALASLLAAHAFVPDAPCPIIAALAERPPAPRAPARRKRTSGTR